MQPNFERLQQLLPNESYLKWLFLMVEWSYCVTTNEGAADFEYAMALSAGYLDLCCNTQMVLSTRGSSALVIPMQ